MGQEIIGEKILPDDHVVRTVSKTKWESVRLNNNAKIIVSSDVFLPREDFSPEHRVEPYVSVDWLEYFHGDLRTKLDQVRNAVQERRRTVGKEARFAVVKVEDVHDAGKIGGKSLEVKTTGEVDHPSHSGRT